MIEFREVSLSDAQKCREFFENSKSMSCDYTFGNLYCWKEAFDYKIAFSKGFLFIRAGTDERSYFLPMGSSNIAYALEMLRDEEKGDVRIYGVSKEDLSFLEGNNIKIKQKSYYKEASDYIYKTQDLVNLSGKKYHSKRNFISRFEKAYSWSYEHLDVQNLHLCEDVLKQWKIENVDKTNTETEEKAIVSSLENFSSLKLSGGILKVSDKPVAFTIGEPINDEIFCIHTEKALSNYTGSYAMLNRLFLAESCLQYEYVNREEDMGIEGLRKAKESYHPVFIYEKYNIVI